MVLSERRRCSSLKFCVVPTRDDSDIVTCIFTRAKFWVGREEEHVCLWALEPHPRQDLLSLLTSPLSPPALHLFEPDSWSGLPW